MSLMQNTSSDVMQQWRTHMQPFHERKDSIKVFGFVLLLMKNKVSTRFVESL